MKTTLKERSWSISGWLDTILDSCAGIFKQSMGAKNREGIGMPYRPARLHMLAESILELLKGLKIRALKWGIG